MVLHSPSPSATTTQKPKTREEELAQEYSAAYGSGGGYSGNTGATQIYMGQRSGGEAYQHGSPGNVQTVTPPKQDILMSRSEAYSYINNLDPKGLADMQMRMILGGLIGENDGFIEMQKKWKQLVDAGYGLNKAGQKVSPMDILNSYLGMGPLGGKGGLGSLGKGAGGSVWQTQYRGGRKFLVNSQTGEVKYQGPRFETTYQKSIDLTDPATAKAIAQSVFQQLMHRDPGAGELKGWGTALHSAEEANPVNSQTTVEYNMKTGEPIGQTTKSSGGLTSEGRQYLAEQRVKKTKEYASVQAATTYMNALESAIFNNPFGSI